MSDLLRGSTTQWMTNFQNSGTNHEKILTKFEERGGIEKKIKREGEPINILCFDGGGMRGYALVVILEMMQKKVGKNLLECFDLVGGTSVGGCGALICNRSDTLETGHMLMRDVIDDVRENCFEGLKTSRNLLRLVSQGSLLRKEQHIIEVMKVRFPNEPLLNKSGVPTFVVTAKKAEQKGDDGDVQFEPFILRSYEYEHDNEDKDNTTKDIYTPLADSTSSVLLCEAMAATSAVPPVVDRVSINCDGKQLSLGDGGAISNSPVVHAFDEANRLYPDRPIGVVVSLGFTNEQDANISRAVDVMRMSSPGLHFQRIAPHEIMDSFKCEESDLTNIAIMESRIRDYMVNTPRVVNNLDITIERLVHSRQTPKRNTPPLKSLKVFQDMFKNPNFEKRQSHRRASTAVYRKSILERSNNRDFDNLEEDTSLIQSTKSIVENGDTRSTVSTPETTLCDLTRIDSARLTPGATSDKSQVSCQVSCQCVIC